MSASSSSSSKLLIDEEETRLFCRSFLIPYHRPRLLYCNARNKYAQGQLSTATRILERTIVRFDAIYANNITNRTLQLEDNFIHEIKKIQALAAAGLYTDRKAKNNLRIQEDWMVLYVTAFPLDEEDASDAFVTKVMETRNDQRKALLKLNAKSIDDKPKTESRKLNNNMELNIGMKRIHNQLTSFLHSSPCKEYRYLKLDVDTKDPALIQQLQKPLTGAKIIIAVQTRGGYHVVIEKGPVCRQLYKFVGIINKDIPVQEHWVTIENESPFIAIPGTNQGGFTVRLATEEWILGCSGNK